MAPPDPASGFSSTSKDVAALAPTEQQAAPVFGRSSTRGDYLTAEGGRPDEADRAGISLKHIQHSLGHEDPRTTERYIRTGRDLGRSPAYVLRFG